MGAAAVPEWRGTTVSWYVPPRIQTVSPGWARFAAAWIVRNGSASVPGLASAPPAAETYQLDNSLRGSSDSTVLDIMGRNASVPARQPINPLGRRGTPLPRNLALAAVWCQLSFFTAPTGYRTRPPERLIP